MGSGDKEANRVRIAWFTPFSKKSAIGLYSKYACEALKAEYSIEIYTSDTEELYETDIPVKRFSTIQEISWSKIDACFYNIGDNSNYHSAIVDCAMHCPGILILHDRSILNLWTGYYLLHKEDRSQLQWQLKEHYGEDATDEILDAMSDAQKWSRVDSEKYSGLELIVPYARAVIVHSKYHQAFVEKHCHGPVQLAYFPVPWDQPCTATCKKPKIMKLLTVGHVNYNKRVAQVIEAIGTSPQLAGTVQYIVAGSLENEAYAQSLAESIQKYHLQDTVFLKGYTPRDELENLYQKTNILINLRNPALEGASWSLVEEMLTGKPIIVSKTGFYAEIPEDCVYQISTDDSEEILAIQNALLWMIDHWDEAQEMGQRAYQYAKMRFAPEQYAAQIQELLEILEFHKPLEQLVDIICYEFQSIGINAELDICKEYADEMEKLFFLPSKWNSDQ